MSENQPTERKPLGMNELATKWGINRKSLSRYIKKLKDKIPLYEHNQRVFYPSQYIVLANELGFEI